MIQNRYVLTDKKSLEEVIRQVEEGASVTLPVNGNSMLPFIIGGKESVILKAPDHIGVGDVVLAWADGCCYVMHRIIRIDGDCFTLMGDGKLGGTEQCQLNDIKARVTHVIGADGKWHDLYSKWRMRAARLWYWLRPIRRFLLPLCRR